MQGLPQRALSQATVEGFHSPCTACIRLVEWRDRKSIVTLLTTTNPSISLACMPRMSEGRGEMQGCPRHPGPLVKLLVRIP
jgi:hypothetical protein